VIGARSLEIARRVDGRFLRGEPLRAARAELPGRGELAARAFDQVRLLREIARRIADSEDDLPDGRPAAVVLSLQRQLIYWTLVAGGRAAAASERDLAGLWPQADHDKLLRAAGGERELEAVRRLLVEMSPVASLDATDEDVERVRAFADALYDGLAAPRRRVAWLRAQRWLILAGVAAAVLLVALGVRRLVLGPNMARSAEMKLSSTFAGCSDDPSCSRLLFHTYVQDNPWVEFDLGKPKPIQLVDIRNRPDCCQDRQIPLIIEVSTDGSHWKEVARNDKAFAHWTAKLPPTTARFVRLRVPTHTWFGFAAVKIL
jgi:hypothetical protein